MHTPVEMLELADIERTIDLLTEFVVRLDRDTDFTPGRPAARRDQRA
jgi:putative aminopeptidase FrvX